MGLLHDQWQLSLAVVLTGMGVVGLIFAKLRGTGPPHAVIGVCHPNDRARDFVAADLRNDEGPLISQGPSVGPNAHLVECSMW